MPPLEVMLALKDYGKIFFAAPKSIVPDFLSTSAQTFDLNENFSVVEVELSPQLRRELYRRTPQGLLDDKKNQIRQTASKLRDVAEKFKTLPPQDKNACLDEYIAELTHAEKILNEIFPELHSDKIKLNFSMLKEFMIDLRLYDDLQLKSRAAEDLNRQIKIFMRDLNAL